VTSLEIETHDRLDEIEKRIQMIMRDRGIVQGGDLVVLTGGHPIYRHGPTNFLKVMQIE
jgi:pyruvate kinase